MGAATAAAAAARNKVRRSSDALSCLISLDIILSCLSIGTEPPSAQRGDAAARHIPRDDQ